MKKIVFGNQKGGVGKTTCAIHFACTSAGYGEKTVLIDADSQLSSMAFRSSRPDDLSRFQAVSILEPTIHEDINDFVADKVYIDAGGRDSKVFRSAIMASDALIIPIVASQFDIWASQDTFDLYAEIKQLYDQAGQPLKCGLVINMMQEGTVISKQVDEVIQDLVSNYKLHVFENKLHLRIGYKECISEGRSVVEMKGEKFKKASFEFLDFYNEVMAWV